MRLAIFDLDGTLFDSMGIWEKLAYNYLIKKGIEVEPNIRESLKEYSLYEASIVIKERFNLKESGDEINHQMEEILRYYYENTIPLKEGAKELLERLKNQGIRIVAATATIDPLAIAALKRLQIFDYFEFVQTCKGVGIEKYKKEFYQLIVERTGVLPRDMVVFEDALHSMEAANKIGIRVVAIKDDSAKSDFDKIEKIADLVIENFNEVCINI